MSYQLTPIEESVRAFITEMKEKHGIEVTTIIEPEPKWVIHGNISIPGHEVFNRAKIAGYTVHLTFHLSEKQNPLPTA